MPAVQLPLIDIPGIELPAPPSDPPTLADIASATKLLSRLSENKSFSSHVHIATDDDLSNAQVYLHNLCDQRARVGENALPTTGTIRQIIRDELRPIIRDELRPLKLISYRAFNTGCSSGDYRSYEVIPFVNADGSETLPTALHLPALRTVENINGLTNQNLNVYLDRYAIPRQGNPARNTKLRRLRAFVGCSIDV